MMVHWLILQIAWLLSCLSSYYLLEFAEFFFFHLSPNGIFFFFFNRTELIPDSFPQFSLVEKKGTNEIFESVKKLRSLRSSYIALRHCSWNPYILNNVEKLRQMKKKSCWHVPKIRKCLAVRKWAQSIYFIWNKIEMSLDCNIWVYSG